MLIFAHEAERTLVAYTFFQYLEAQHPGFSMRHMIKYLISITPQVHISFISKGFGGRVSDKLQVKVDIWITRHLQNDLVFGDRDDTE